MANYYSDNRKFYLNTLDLKEIVENLEDNFEGDGPEDLHSFEEAKEWYDMVLKR